MPQLNIKIPDRHMRLFQENFVFCILYGGRDSAKTGSFIRYIVTNAMRDKINVLCVREYQSSIPRSVYKELKTFIDENNLSPNHFTIKHDKIVGANGSEMIFAGIARDPMSIKGIPDIDICFIEEAEALSEDSWDILLPTLYKNPKVKILVAFNPKERMSATYQKLIVNSEFLPSPLIKIHTNYDDNPFLSPLSKRAIELMRLKDYARFEHIYLGKPLDMDESVIFKDCFKVERMELSRLLPTRYGLDFGFSPDPLAFVKIVIVDKDTLYIDKEIYAVGLLPSQIKKRILSVCPEAINQLIYADSSRNDTIAELCNDGLRVKGAVKGKGSIESGIEFLKGKKIIINPDCANTRFEFYNYKLKQDKVTGEIVPIPVDKNNHIIDCCRYAMNDEITSVRRRLNVSNSVLRMFGVV